jgi:hypothetical protein
MSGPSGSSPLQGLVEAALEDYKKQTGIDLANHILAGRLQDCKSVGDVTAVLRVQTQDFKKFREKDKVLKLLKRVLTTPPFTILRSPFLRTPYCSLCSPGTFEGTS